MDIVHDIYDHPGAREIEAILAQYVPPSVTAYLAKERATIVPIPAGVTYARASPVVRRTAIGVDTWPNPPAGLFVAQERTIYLRTVSSMTVIHELGHALDCALGGGVYLKRFRPNDPPRVRERDPVRDALRRDGGRRVLRREFRAYCGANDPSSLWPTVTRARLEAASPAMASFFARVLVDLERRQSPAVTTLLAGACGRSRQTRA